MWSISQSGIQTEVQSEAAERQRNALLISIEDLSFVTRNAKLFLRAEHS